MKPPATRSSPHNVGTAASRVPAGPQLGTDEVSGMALVWETPFRGFRTRYHLVPLTVVRDDLNGGYWTEASDGRLIYDSVSERHRAKYVEYLLAKGLLPRNVPLARFELAYFYPGLTRAGEKKVAHIHQSKEHSPTDLTWALLLEPRYAVKLDDYEPVREAWNLPARAQFTSEGGRLVARLGKRIVASLTVSDLIGAELGPLMSFTIAGFAPLIRSWPIGEVCTRASQLESSGEAFLLQLLWKTNDPEQDAQEIDRWMPTVEEFAELMSKDPFYVSESSDRYVDQILADIRKGYGWKGSSECR
jgi:hypothetical protein